MTPPKPDLRLLQSLALCLAIGMLFSGCSAQQEIATEENVIESVAAKPQAEVEPATEKATIEEPSNAENEMENLSEPEASSFELPFPDRVELFVAPKRRGRGAKKSADGIDNAVELLGFVNVDGQRVVLSIDGLVSPLSEGSQIAGIEVISIQPPAVVLQRGRQRWQVNIEY